MNTHSKLPHRFFIDDESIESLIYQKGKGPTPADLLDKFMTMGLSALSQDEKILLNLIMKNNDLQ